MEDKEILIKAIAKAVNNGCSYNTYEIDVNLWVEKKLYFSVIFAQDFAQAFWPDQDNVSFIESPIKELVIYEKQKSSWRYHLKQMVLEVEPLKYLEKFLDV